MCKAVGEGSVRLAGNRRIGDRDDAARRIIDAAERNRPEPRPSAAQLVPFGARGVKHFPAFCPAPDIAAGLRMEELQNKLDSQETHWKASEL